MSDWYVFSAIGGYPVDPTRSELVLSAPVFPRVEISPRGGRPVTIVAEGADADGRYITGVRANGENWTRSSLPEGLIARGGTVELDLAATPSPKFAAAQQDRPTGRFHHQCPARTAVRCGVSDNGGHPLGGGTYSVPIEIDVEDVPGAPHDGTQMLWLTVDVR